MRGAVACPRGAAQWSPANTGSSTEWAGSAEPIDKIIEQVQRCTAARAGAAILDFTCRISIRRIELPPDGYCQFLHASPVPAYLAADRRRATRVLLHLRNFCGDDSTATGR
jgi:hypothetical protein